jgi:hypothetical protein
VRCHESRNSDERDCRHLDDGERGLDGRPVPNANVVDGRENEDSADRDDAYAGIAKRDEEPHIARTHRGDRRDDPRVHAPEHRPAPEERDRR